MGHRPVPDARPAATQDVVLVPAAPRALREASRRRSIRAPADKLGVPQARTGGQPAPWPRGRARPGRGLGPAPSTTIWWRPGRTTPPPSGGRGRRSAQLTWWSLDELAVLQRR